MCSRHCLKESVKCEICMVNTTKSMVAGRCNGFDCYAQTCSGVTKISRPFFRTYRPSCPVSTRPCIPKSTDLILRHGLAHVEAIQLVSRRPDSFHAVVVAEGLSALWSKHVRKLPDSLDHPPEHAVPHLLVQLDRSAVIAPNEQVDKPGIHAVLPL